MPLLNPNQFISGQQLNEANGLEEATNFPAGPNSKLAIFDKNDDVFYIKQTDGYGNVVYVRTFEYKERVQKPPLDDRYVTVEQMNSFKDEIIGEIRNAQFSIQPTSTNSANDNPNAKPGKPYGRNNGPGKANGDAAE